MNSKVMLALSTLLAYIFVIFIPYAWTGIFASIPLYRINIKRAGIAGFIIGFSTISIYLIYPSSKLLELSEILGKATGIQGLILIIIYPLFYGIIMMLSAMLFSELKKK